MSATIRKSAWPLVAILGLLYLAYDVGSQQHITGDGPTFVQGPLRVEYLPDPNDMVNLAEGTPYTVPAGKVLIITDYTVTNAAISWDGRYLTPRIRLDGVDAWGTGWCTPGFSASSPQTSSTGSGVLTASLRSGVRANAGQIVTLHANPIWAFPQFPWVETNDHQVIPSPVMFSSGYLAKAD